MVKKLFIGLVQQGVPIDQNCVSVTADSNAATTTANDKAQALNDAATGEEEGWTGVVLEYDMP